MVAGWSEGESVWSAQQGDFLFFGIFSQFLE